MNEFSYQSTHREKTKNNAWNHCGNRSVTMSTCNLKTTMESGSRAAGLNYCKSWIKYCACWYHVTLSHIKSVEIKDNLWPVIMELDSIHLDESLPTARQGNIFRNVCPFTGGGSTSMRGLRPGEVCFHRSASGRGRGEVCLQGGLSSPPVLTSSGGHCLQ